jgi:acyl carrier protein
VTTRTGHAAPWRGDLLTFINNQVSLNPSTPVLGDTDLLLTGLVDSVGVFEIVSWLHQATGIDIDPIHIVIDNFRTVDQIVALVERLHLERPA